MNTIAKLTGGTIISGGLFALLDLLYLTILRRKHHVTYFQDNFNEGNLFKRPFPIYGALVWLIMGLGVETLVLPNSITVSDAFLKGGLYGFILYAVYNGTNLATLNNWSHTFAIQDVLWGTLLSALVSATRKYIQIK